MVRFLRTPISCAAALAIGVVLVSSGSNDDPHTPPALPGRPPPFLGTTVTGDGGLTAAVDAYGDVVDLRAPGPAGTALIHNQSDRQAAGTVPEDTGIVPRVRIGGGPVLPMWKADSVSQRYLRGTNVVRTVARFGEGRVVMTTATAGNSLAVSILAEAPAVPSLTVNVAGQVRCARARRAGQLDLLCRVGRAAPPVAAAAQGDALPRACASVIDAARTNGRHWLRRSSPLGARRAAGPSSTQPSAPAWARTMYGRALLTVHALTSRATGAVAAGARDGWAYVWPRDAASAALALAVSGHGAEAREVTRFLTRLDLPLAARFTESGAPVPGRAAQGDAAGWVDAAARATDLPATSEPLTWRNRADYQESSPGTYLGNALAAAGTLPRAHPAEEAARIAREFGTGRGLLRSAEDSGSGLDSAAGWAVRPFRLAALYPAAEETLLRLVKEGTRYGITPGEGWTGGGDPWTAPTAWNAWALAGLAAEWSRESASAPRRSTPRGRAAIERRAAGDRRAALALLGDLRRAATPAGSLPERIGARTGIPTSTTPLLWSSALTVLALRELWP